MHYTSMASAAAGLPWTYQSDVAAHPPLAVSRGVPQNSRTSRKLCEDWQQLHLAYSNDGKTAVYGRAEGGSVRQVLSASWQEVS